MSFYENLKNPFSGCGQSDVDSKFQGCGPKSMTIYCKLARKQARTT